jgi:poly-D-alanine transfer protein DltD
MALAAGALLWLASFPLMRAVENAFMPELLAMEAPEKENGVLLQREAFQRADILPVYGSCELEKPWQYRHTEEQWRQPGGFQICPVGSGGSHTFIMAERIAALGDAVRGRKLAIILSSVWFRMEGLPEGHMRGTFSPLQAIDLLQSPEISEPLRARFVARWREFDGLMHNHPALEAYVGLYGKEGSWAACQRSCLSKVLSAERVGLQWDDHLQSVEAGFAHGWLHRGDWRFPKGLAADDKGGTNAPDAPPEHRITHPILEADGTMDEEYIRVLNASHEWSDFAVLLDTLKELGARPLIISIPLPGLSNNKHHISRRARDVYYQRMEAMCAERGFACRTFADHDLDPDLILGASTHLSEKGWQQVSQLLDDFYHDRFPVAMVSAHAP